MKLILCSKVPRRNITVAALCYLDLDWISGRLGATPSNEMYRDALITPQRYRQVCLVLSSGRYATLTQAETRKPVTEIGLEIRNDEFFYEVDLFEIIGALGIEEDFVKRQRGDFTWIKPDSKGGTSPA